MQGNKILIVDDDLDVLRLISRKLSQAGFDCVFAEDGVGAMSVARKEKPDLMLLDLGLPAGGGFDVLERCQRHLPFAQMPVAVITGNDEDEARAKALRSGAVAFFRKPLDLDQLVGDVSAILSEA